MNSIKQVLWATFGALMIVAGVAAVTSGSATAQSAGSVRAQVYICPQDYTGPDWVQRCDLLPDVEVSAYLDASEYGFTNVTDSNGEAYFPDLGVGEFVIELGVPGDFADFHSYCGAPGETEPRPVEGAGTNRIFLDVGEEEELYCTFFVVPVDARGDQPAEPAGVETVNTLPSTGAGGRAHAGTELIVALAVAAVVSGMAAARVSGRLDSMLASLDK